MSMSKEEELTECAILENKVIEAIEKQNWTNEILTDAEKHLIGMAISATIYELKVNQP